MRTIVAAFLCVVALCACGGGGGSSVPAQPIAINFVPSSLTFASPTAPSQMLTVQLQNFSGNVANTTGDTCDPSIATFTTVSTSSTQYVFSVQPVSVGTCSVTFSGNSITSAVTVTVN